MKSVPVKDFTIEQIDKAQQLLEDVERAERELNNFIGNTVSDLEEIRYLQEQVQYKYSRYLNFIGLSDKELLN